MCPRKRAAMGFADRIHRNSCVPELVHVGRPTRAGCVDRRTALRASRSELQKRPSVATVKRSASAVGRANAYSNANLAHRWSPRKACSAMTTATWVEMPKRLVSQRTEARGGVVECCAQENKGSSCQLPRGAFGGSFLMFRILCRGLDARRNRPGSAPRCRGFR